MRIEILHDPIAWKRAGRNGRFTFDAQAEEKKSVRWKMTLQCRECGHKPLTGPVVANFDFGIGMPASWSFRRKAKSLGQPVVTRPDLDNYEKFYLDCGNGILWEDDSQVYFVTKAKKYTNMPKVVIDFSETPLILPGDDA